LFFRAANNCTSYISNALATSFILGLI